MIVLLGGWFLVNIFVRKYKLLLPHCMIIAWYVRVVCVCLHTDACFVREGNFCAYTVP